MAVNKPPRPGSPLTSTEIRVLAGVARGHSNNQIGETLGRSPLTVKAHLGRIACRLGTGHRAQIVAYGYHLGYLTGLPAEARLEVVLTRRQRQVLEGIAAGRPLQDIADEMDRHLETVKSHSLRLYRALGALNGAHAVALAFQHGHLTARAASAAAA